MKRIFASRREHHLIKVCVFLITVALIGGMVGCNGNGGESYTLTITSTAGGNVTTPGEGMFTYDEGAVGDLVAEADEGYMLVNWTGNVSAIADVYAASTTITMNGHYSITANFVIAIEIRDWYDLDAVRNNLGSSYFLLNNLNSTTAGYEELASPTANGGKGWQPIGTHNDPFTGTFDGQEYEIRDLCSNRPDEGYIGLFGYVDDGSIIENLGVVNANVMTGALVGGLVGFNRGTVNNCYSTGNIAGYMAVGGLMGVNDGTVSNSYFTGSVTCNYYMGAGGLVGQNRGIVSNSYYSYDEVLINGENIITIGALFDEDFEEWLANDKFLDVNDRLSQEDSYYVVNNVGDFKELLAFGQDALLKFRLTDDLDLATEPNFYIPYLAGEFDGNDHKILNLSLEFEFVSYVGLFGYLASGGSVHDVAAESSNIIACVCVGGLLGFNAGTVVNSSSTGSVTGNVSVGGLVGVNDGTVSNSYSTGSVTCNYYMDAGGLVGANVGTLSNSYATGSVSGDKHVGGLVGSSTGSVSNSYSTSSVTGEDDVGGLVGLNTDYATVSNAYSSSNVTGGDNVGGLVGYNYDGTISNSHSTGSVTGDGLVGGLVGKNPLGTVGNSFWDTETSGQATSAGGTGKTTAEMQDIDTFSGAGWDIVLAPDPTHIWNIVDDETYPFLSWQP